MAIQKLCLAGLMLCLQLFFAEAAEAQLSDAAKSVVLIGNRYDVLPNITYGIANNYELKLDVYRPTIARQSTWQVRVKHDGKGSRGI